MTPVVPYQGLGQKANNSDSPSYVDQKQAEWVSGSKALGLNVFLPEQDSLSWFPSLSIMEDALLLVQAQHSLAGSLLSSQKV